MPLSPALLALLADPETHEPLSLASEGELARLREALRKGAVRRSGQPVAGEPEAALLTPSRKVAYLIESDIPNLLVDERIELSEAL
ncbi:MAG: hypothetical protein ABW252_10885 [Polyangiales bacterium]